MRNLAGHINMRIRQEKGHTPELLAILLHIQATTAFLPNLPSIEKDSTAVAGERVDRSFSKTVSLESVNSVMAWIVVESTP